MTTNTELAKRIDELSDTVAGLCFSLTDAEKRCDDAEKRCDRLVLLMTRVLRRTSVEAPSTVPRHEYDAALLELRGNDAQSTERFASETIVRKALDRRIGVAFENVRHILERMDRAEQSKAAEG